MLELLTLFNWKLRNHHVTPNDYVEVVHQLRRLILEALK